jgi:hypothetical protein
MARWTVAGIISDADIAQLAADLAPGSSSAILVWENTWAAELGKAVAGSSGRIAARGVVPREAVVHALAAAEGK